MKNLFLTLSFCFGIVALGYSQQSAEVKKATPAVSITSADKTAAAESGDVPAKACCKGKSSKDCCKGKKGDAKACAHKEGGSTSATHSCAGHGAKAADATGAKPACCAGKKDGAACSHHGHGAEMKKEEAK